jgi:hypothetical protein
MIALLVAALLLFALGLAHSWLGERYIVGPLLRRSDLPRLFGDDGFTRATIRYAWHLTTLAWWGLATVLVVVSGAMTTVPVGDGLLLALAVTFFCSGLLGLLATRGRHLSWIVLLALAVLTLLPLL